MTFDALDLFYFIFLHFTHLYLFLSLVFALCGLFNFLFSPFCWFVFAICVLNFRQLFLILRFILFFSSLFLLYGYFKIVIFKKTTFSFLNYPFLSVCCFCLFISIFFFLCCQLSSSNFLKRFIAFIHLNEGVDDKLGNCHRVSMSDSSSSLKKEMAASPGCPGKVWEPADFTCRCSYC